MYICLNDQLLDQYGASTDEHERYIDIFSWILPTSVFCVPFFDYTLRLIGVKDQLHLTTCIGMLYGALVLVPYLDAQILTFVLFVFYRAYAYSAIAVFLAQTFGEV